MVTVYSSRFVKPKYLGTSILSVKPKIFVNKTVNVIKFTSWNKN